MAGSPPHIGVPDPLSPRILYFLLDTPPGLFYYPGEGPPLSWKRAITPRGWRWARASPADGSEVGGEVTGWRKRRRPRRRSKRPDGARPCRPHPGRAALSRMRPPHLAQLPQVLPHEEEAVAMPISYDKVAERGEGFSSTRKRTQGTSCGSISPTSSWARRAA